MGLGALNAVGELKLSGFCALWFLRRRKRMLFFPNPPLCLRANPHLKFWIVLGMELPKKHWIKKLLGKPLD